MQVILASASPRRLALLQQIGIEATVCPADFDEVSGSAVQAEDVVLAILSLQGMLRVEHWGPRQSWSSLGSSLPKQPDPANRRSRGATLSGHSTLLASTPSPLCHQEAACIRWIGRSSGPW